MEELPVLDDGEKKKAKVDKESGMMSKLPEEIVVSILRFLPVEEAARLRGVCRQWKELWNTMIRFTPRLKFVRKKALKAGEASSREYAKGVDQVIITKWNAEAEAEAEADDDHDLELEELTVDVPLDKSFSDDVNRWVEFGAKRRVKKLRLDFFYTNGLQCSATFLANLNMFWLKDLSLKSLDVGDKDIDCIFANSPNLERLSVTGSAILVRFEAASPNSAPNLKYLAIDSCKNLERLHISNPNLDIVISCGEHCWPKEVKISSPHHLSQLNPKFCFYSSFFDYDPRTPLGQPNPFVCIKKGFPNFDPYRELFGQLKRLRLKIPREVFRFNSYFFGKFFPKLSEVEQLEVVLLPSKNDPLPHGMVLLEAAPFLHDLSIQLRPLHRYHKISFGNRHFKWVEKDTPLRAKAWGSHQNLEVVKLVGFCGCKEEVELVLNFVKIAVSLKKIIIHFLPLEYWQDLSPEQVNQYSKICQRSTQLLKTQIPPHILVVIT